MEGPLEFPVLSTERLELAEITDTNAPDIFELFSHPEVVRFYNLLPLAIEEDAQAIIERFRQRFADKLGIRWGIRLKGSAKIIGTTGFNNFTRNHRSNIGYDLLPAYWNKGLISEAIMAVAAYGFDKLEVNRIEAEVMAGNSASERALVKCGFKKEGILRQWMHWNEQHFDMTIYALLREDFRLVQK